MLLDDAIQCPWISPNTDSGINALMLDLDHDDALELRYEAQRAGDPIPDLVIDPWSGRAHAVLWLTSSVATTAGAKERPQQAADYAGRLLAAAWRGTVMPVTGLVKSPWGRVTSLAGQRLKRTVLPSQADRWAAYESTLAAGADLMWTTVPGTGPTDLKTVIAALAPRFEFDAGTSKRTARKRRNRGTPDGRGRNCELFDVTRWWAYDHAETNTDAIQAEANRLNNSGLFATPLPAAEVTAMARSIGRFMRDRYRPRHGQDASRGRDREAGTTLGPQARQALAGRRTAEDRVTGTDIAIADATDRLRAKGTSLTQAAIATEAGISLSTVKRRWSAPFKVSNAVVSDGDRRSPGVSLPLKNPKSPSFLSDIAILDHRIRNTVNQLAALTATASRPGATPPQVPPVPADLLTVHQVRTAYRDAVKAADDAARRTRARTVRRLAADRALTMRAAVLSADRGAAWWREHLSVLDAEWDGLAKDVPPRDRDALWRYQTGRDAAFASRWTQWRAALRAVATQRADQAQVENRIPW